MSLLQRSTIPAMTASSHHDHEDSGTSVEPSMLATDEPDFVFRPVEYAVGGRKGLSPSRFVIVVGAITALLAGNAAMDSDIDVRALFASCSDARASSRREAAAMVAVARSVGDTHAIALAEGLASNDLEAFFARANDIAEQEYRMSAPVLERYESLKAAIRFEDHACGNASRIQSVEIPADSR